MNGKKVLVIIPAYNEEKNVGNVIRKIKKDANADIVVINDGSKDKTASAARDAGVRVIDLPFNLGIGGAMQTGYRFAKENGYEAAVQVDADGQHDPAFINFLVDKLDETGCSMIIGSRYVAETSYKSSVSRRIGMIFFSWLVQVLTGWKVKDTTSGFRVVDRKVIEYFAQSYPADYPEVDVLVRLHKKGFTVCEVPVEMQERQGGKSSITPVKSIYYMVKVSLALLINSLRSGEIS
ncbi:MAG TPA: glycosyltransferase family 2 protein [Clostridia bacterium]